MAYLRVSTARQAEEGMGLEVQRDRVAECAKAKNLDLIGVVEEAASGGVREGEELSYEHRPVLLDLMDRAKAREFEVLLVARLDRLSRDYPTLAVLERRFLKHGVEVVSASEGNGDGPLGEFIRGQLALVAQLERAMILERVRAGKAKKKALGRHVHGRVPYGYRSDRGVLSPVEEEALVVKRIYLEARDGRTPGQIAKILNKDGIESPSGATWGRTTVRSILANPAYAGERHGIRKAHLPVVSRRLWNAAQLALAARSAS